MSWSLPPEAFAFLAIHLASRQLLDPVIVELGSGEGTAKLAEYASVVSIEHDPRFLHQHASRYIHAPIVDGWYDPAPIREGLPQHYDCLIVDGPPGAIGRSKLLHHLDLFLDVPLLVDDVQRPAERELAIELAKTRKKNLSFHYLQSGRAFASIGWM